MSEREPEPEHSTPADSLEEWREAERDAEAQPPGSAAAKMARQRADAARDDFHEAEDEVGDRQGNHRPRKHDDPPAG